MINIKRLASDTRGQDLIEYALMAGFVAVAAGAVMPGVANTVERVLAKMNATLAGIETAAYPAVSEETAIIRIVCAILAPLFLALIVMRRKNSSVE